MRKSQCCREAPIAAHDEAVERIITGLDSIRSLLHIVPL